MDEEEREGEVEEREKGRGGRGEGKGKFPSVRYSVILCNPMLFPYRKKGIKAFVHDQASSDYLK